MKLFDSDNDELEKHLKKQNFKGFEEEMIYINDKLPKRLYDKLFGRGGGGG